MAKHEGARTVVVGGKKETQQQYCGTVGGQSTDFSTIDSEIKTTHLKNHSLAPPDLYVCLLFDFISLLFPHNSQQRLTITFSLFRLVNGVQGITWRLGFGITNPNQPEEWQDHSATLNLPISGNL
ncbi:hypothetical protein H0H87_003644 [Tephrocybe sp. NHM501043]|nr:hypothetical protein H0H87_003644 [Tephrocybe sp. NHM501043]